MLAGPLSSPLRRGSWISRTDPIEVAATDFMKFLRFMFRGMGPLPFPANLPRKARAETHSTEYAFVRNILYVRQLDMLLIVNSEVEDGQKFVGLGGPRREGTNRILAR